MFLQSCLSLPINGDLHQTLYCDMMFISFDTIRRNLINIMHKFITSCEISTCIDCANQKWNYLSALDLTEAHACVYLEKPRLPVIQELTLQGNQYVFSCKHILPQVIDCIDSKMRAPAFLRVAKNILSSVKSSSMRRGHFVLK